MSRLQLFNLDTMSGVYPGTRTQVYQRIRLLPLADDDQRPCWAVLLWYDDPPACLVVRQGDEGGAPEQEPLALLEEPLTGDLNRRLCTALAERGWQMRTCGACDLWQPAAARNEGGLQVGVCTLRASVLESGAPEVETPAVLASQSHLALGCQHWLSQRAEAASSQPARAQPDQSPVAPLPRIAVTTESKLPRRTRWRLRLQRLWSPPTAATTAIDQVTERSGVGAGTEPCFVCQGRLANLGALSVESPDGDKETFSVWRCRECWTLFLSDWIDRWERVDSLETEETIYRIAPAEAAEFLTLFASVPAGDHPQHRGTRGPQRAWIVARMEGREPVSHVVKQGR